MADKASHALASSATAKHTFNVEEEVAVIRNGWTPKEEEVLVAVVLVALLIEAAVVVKD